jgi:magnesium chelatase subunit D
MLSQTPSSSPIQPFFLGLACAAVAPSLRSILIFDVPYQGLESAASILAQMFQAAGQEVQQVHLGASDLDDDLWGSLEVRELRGRSPVIWHRGLLAETWNDPIIRLAIIPDLNRVSLAVARACVMLMSTSIAHLERHGQHQQWTPNICWVAGCVSSEVGGISPHLLDRFALRFRWPGLLNTDPTDMLLKQILMDKAPEEAPALSLTTTLKESIQYAARHWARYTNQAIRRVLSYSPTSGVYLHRREITLARLSQALARIEGAEEVTEAHVDRAALLIGLVEKPRQATGSSPSQPDTIDSTTIPSSSPHNETTVTRPRGTAEHIETAVTQSEAVGVLEPVYSAGHTEILEQTVLPGNPYPEDKAPIEREADSLRLPFTRYASKKSDRGTIIGVEQATYLHDIALVSTLFAAAPFQLVRHKYQQRTAAFALLSLRALFQADQQRRLLEEKQRFLLSPMDLRSYRRAPSAERLLLILLDHTSLHECNWQEALLPYLRSAYTDRSSISIVQVGSAHAAIELQADVVSARSVLVPQIGVALEEKRGKATPLAHGFDLALRTLIHALQQGRSTVQQALFVVITDGRGNIPLESSRTGQVIGAIHRQGIEDTLQIARFIRDMNGVHTIVLNPQPRHYSDLPLMLADALGAEVQNIQHIDDGEMQR